MRPLLSVLAIVALVAGGCSLLNSLDGYAGSKPEATAQPPAAEAGTQEDAGCTSARPPLRPAPTGHLDGGSLSFVAAFSKFSFGDAMDGGSLTAKGYDLDNLCSCPGARACDPKGRSSVCDLANGIDNSAGSLFLEITSLLGAGNSPDPAKSANIDSNVRAGNVGLLLRVRKYNGEPDDDEVECALLNTMGIESPDGGTSHPAPLADGNDKWTVDSDSFASGTPGLAIGADTRAYVRGGILVAELKSTLRVGNLTFPVTSGIVTATVAKRGRGYALEDGVLAFRMNVKNLLTSLEGIPISSPAFPGFLCGTDPTYAQIRKKFCEAQDLPSDRAVDGHEDPCDALSLVIGFRADPAIAGKEVVRPKSNRPCGDSWMGTCE